MRTEMWDDCPTLRFDEDGLPPVAKRHICYGGGSTPSGNTTSTQTVNTGPWEAQQPYLKDVFSEAQRLYGDKTSPAYFPGSTVAGPTAAQTQGYQAAIDRATAGSPLLPAANKTALSTINGSFLDPSSNPYLAKTYGAAADQVGRTFQNVTAPTTDAMFSGAGRYGSGARYNAQRNNDMGLGVTLDNLGTSIYGGNYQNERGIQAATTANAPTMAAADYIDPTALETAGGQQQQQQQSQLSDQVNRWNYDQNRPWNNLARYQSMVQGNYGQQGTTTSTQPYFSNPAGNILGGVMGLGSLFGSLATPGLGKVSALGNVFGANGLNWSDARLKEDIAPIGKTNDGQTLYSYRYKGDSTPQVGLMAQEVERTRPEAVVTDSLTGFKAVNYDLALRDSVLTPRASRKPRSILLPMAA